MAEMAVVANNVFLCTQIKFYFFFAIASRFFLFFSPGSSFFRLILVAYAGAASLEIKFGATRTATVPQEQKTF